MNISETINELRWKVTRCRNAARKESREWDREHAHLSIEERCEHAIEAGRQAARDIAEWERQIRALEAPLVGIVATPDNRVLVATQYCVYELKDGKLVLVTFEREP